MPVAPESIIYRDGYIEVTLQGASRGIHSHFREIHKQIFAASLQHACGLILIDASGLDYHPNVLLEHQTAVDLAERSAAHPFAVRVATISPSNALQANEHLETAARNRGVNVKVFWDRAEALTWLTAPAP